MYAALVMLTIDPARAPAAASAFTNEILPRIQQAPGCQPAVQSRPAAGDFRQVLYRQMVRNLQTPDSRIKSVEYETQSFDFPVKDP